MFVADLVHVVSVSNDVKVPAIINTSNISEAVPVIDSQYSSNNLETAAESPKLISFHCGSIADNLNKKKFSDAATCYIKTRAGSSHMIEVPRIISMPGTQTSS